jgi:radical SAM superfamily enzyme YgiQ (UPF0313 family)
MLLSHEKDPLAKIRRLSPRIVAFSCMTGYHKNILAFASYLKEWLPDTFTIMGGPHPTFYPECLEYTDALDAICVGEGELAMLELVKSLSNGDDHTGIKNLFLKVDGQIKRNPVRELIADLDSFPLPDRNLYYESYGFLAHMTTKRFISGRGCPYRCSFCFNHQYNNLYRGKGAVVRKKSVDRIFSEIENIKLCWPLSTVHFSDDTFLINKKWAEEFCMRYKETLGVPFTLNARFDQFTKDTARMLKEAGCIGCSLGVESGSEEIRNVILKKRLDDKEIFRGAEALHSQGLKIMTTNMIGLPGESVKDAIETIELNIRIQTDFGRIYFFWPFPKTDLTNYALEQNFIRGNIDFQSFDTSKKLIVEDHNDHRIKENIANVFSFVLMVPQTWKILKKCLWMPSAFLRVFQVFTVWCDIRFYRPKILTGIYYFINCASGVLSGNMFRLNERFFSRVLGRGSGAAKSLSADRDR